MKSWTLWHGRRRSRRAAPGTALVAALALPLVLVSASPAATAGEAEPAPTAAVRPGPDILYAEPPRAPQLENAPGSPWNADPILVSGASAYRSGEFLYQDFLFDDRGAGSGYTYPSDPRYAGNAADLVELRLRPHKSNLLVRLTYNAMIDPELVASTLVLGSSAAPRALPFGAGATAPAEAFVTVHGSTAAVTDPVTGEVAARAGATATVDLERRQVTVVIPKSVFDTTKRSHLRVAVASGLWDGAADQYLRPVQGAATASTPGASAAPGSALFNVGFRFGESGQWRDNAQAAALTTGDLSTFFADVDLGKLRARTNDDMPGQPGGVPTSGLTNRIFASHFEDAQGRGPQPPTSYCRQPCWDRVPDYASQLQPYALYVPSKPAPAAGYGMTLNLHYCGGNHNDGPPNAAALAERGTGSLVLTPLGRIPCSWYWSQAGADVFEAWADAGRHFPLDPSFTAISGWSMGGYGAYKLLAQFPDLFARALTDIGCTSAETSWAGQPTPSISGPGAEIVHLVPSYRNVPILSANANADAFCTPTSQEQVRLALDELGYRYDWRVYTGQHGPFFPTNEESAAFLGTARVNPNPPHVTYVYNGVMDQPEWGLNSDHAYWVSGITLRDPAVDDERGTVDAVSHGFGVADAQASRTEPTAGTSGVNVYTGWVKRWFEPEPAAVDNALDLRLTNIAEVTIDVARAKVGCDVRLDIVTDGPTTVHLAGCDRSVQTG